MISNKQKWFLGGLVTLSGAVWTPQVMERFGGATSAQVGVDAGPNEDEMLSIEMESMGQAPSATVPEARRLTAASGGGVGTDANSSSGAAFGVQAGGGQLATGGSTAIVSEVLRTLRQSEAFNADTGLDEVVVPSLVEEQPLVEQEAPEPPSLFAFLEANPLRGTIVGETTNMALIGQHRVHLGEVVPGTGATLTEVKRGRATLMEGSMTFELELKPLETSEELMLLRSQSQGQGQSQGQSQVPGGEPGKPQAGSPGAEGAPGPTTTSETPAPSELPGSRGEF